MANGVKMLQDDRIFSSVFRFNAKILGLVIGILLGLIIFIVTNWIVIMGPQIAPVGEYEPISHLQLLSQFFVGYRVSFLGSFIGFAYGFAVGTLAGALVGWVYNRISYLRK